MECKNCKSLLSETSNYCYACGGRVIKNRLTIRNLFEYFSETFFNYDNTFFQTFIGLFNKPEEIIGCYIDGTRKKYVDVVSYFAIALTISGIQIFILNTFFPDIMNFDFLSPKGMETVQRENMSFAQNYQSILYMLAVPIYALMSRLVFYNYKKFNYTEHIIINMYMSAHFAIVSSITIIITSVLGINYIYSAMAVILAQIIYSAYVLKRLFNLTVGRMLLKLGLFLIVLFILMIIISMASAIFMFLNGDFQKAMNAGQSM